MLQNVYQSLREWLHYPLENYYHLLPTMPKGEKVEDLLANGFPLAVDLLDGILIALVFTIWRYMTTKFFLIQLGRVILKHRYYQIPVNEKIDEILREDRFPSTARIYAVAEELGMKAKDISTYMRHARNREREEKVMVKFTEVAWKLCCHVFLTAFGTWSVLLSEPWMWDADSCWVEYPYQRVSRAVYWYYMLEFGTFSHEILALFVETRRSDFWAMLTHHVATLSLIAGSYICNFIPIGSLVMITHDAADSFLEIAKIFNYMCKPRPWAQKVTDFFFVAFAVVFFITRLIIFPFYVFWNSVTTPPKHLGHHLGVHLLNAFLFVLICLHSYWMYLILRMAIKMAHAGKAEKDGRSDDDEDLEESDEDGEGGGGVDRRRNGSGIARLKSKKAD